MRLNEIAKDISDPKVLKHILEYDCGEMLGLCRTYYARHQEVRFLYRGYSRMPPQGYFTGTSPIDRSPRDTDLELHDVLTELMYDSGLVASRDNSVFVTPNRKMANVYGFGNIYIVFPFDGFAYSWSPKVTDLYDFISLNDLTEKLEEISEEGLTKENIQWFKATFQYRKTDLIRALGGSSEIMFTGPYYAFDSNKFFTALTNIITGKI